jgi:hypothetical protein
VKARALITAAALVAAIPAATTVTVALTEGEAFANTCIANSDLWNVATNRYITVDPNGTMHADSALTPRTELDFCLIGGNWSIMGENSHGWWQDVGWANNIVLAHLPAFNQSDLTQDFILGLSGGGHIIVRARGNTLYLEPTSPADVVYAQGRTVNQWTEWGTDDPRLRQAICGGSCVYAGPARAATVTGNHQVAPDGGAWN